MQGHHFGSIFIDIQTAVVELGNLQVEREFNDVRMVCNAYLGLLKHGQIGEVYNVCSGQSYTLQQVMDTLAELSGHALQIRVNPAFVRGNEVLLVVITQN